MKSVEELNELIQQLRRTDTDAYLSAVAFVCALSRDSDNGEPWATGYTRGNYKRAIKLLREGQRHYQDSPEMVERYDRAVVFIRRNWLRKDVDA